jgi:hypothetical protein
VRVGEQVGGRELGASQNLIGGGKHNNHNHDSISEYEAKVDEHIRTI